MAFVSDEPDGISRLYIKNENTDEIMPVNALVVGDTGSGKSILCEEIADYFFRNGWTVIVLSDVKKELEYGYVAFEPEAKYHIKKLAWGEMPKHSSPVKLYHPFAFNLPKHKIPQTTFFTFNIKNLQATDLAYLAESEASKTSIDIIMNIKETLKSHEGLHHLAFKAEDQTESMANLVKSGVKFRSHEADKLFSKTKVGTEKTAGEISRYLQYFTRDYFLAPEDCKYNINIVDIMNDNKHYHVFHYKYIQDVKRQGFCIIRILSEIFANKDKAKHPILLVIPEINKLLPNKKEGYIPIIAGQVMENLVTMRNTGKGFASLQDAQIYGETSSQVTDACNLKFIGKQTSQHEYDAIGRAMKLSTNQIKLLKELDVGEFIVLAKDAWSKEFSLQKIKSYMPPHAHREVGSKSFSQKWEETYPEQMMTTEQVIKDMEHIRDKVIEEVSTWAEKENIGKRQIVKADREQGLEATKIRARVEMAKLQKKAEKIEEITEQRAKEIYEYWKANKETREGSTRQVAEHFGIYLNSIGNDGKPQPNHTAIQRIIARQTKREEKATDTVIQ